MDYRAPKSLNKHNKLGPVRAERWEKPEIRSQRSIYKLTTAVGACGGIKGPINMTTG